MHGAFQREHICVRFFKRNILYLFKAPQLVAVIKYQDQKQLRRKFPLAYGSRRLDAHSGRDAWQKEARVELRDDISNTHTHTRSRARALEADGAPHSEAA